jgi:uncharacterized membrane protein
MAILVAGLVIFFAVHSVRIFAEGWRAERIRRMGPWAWKGVYSVVSIVGFVLIVWGYGVARQASADLWSPPAWTHALTSIVTLPAFILLAAAYVPGTRIKAALGHPMLVGTKTWAFAHLLSNGRLADVLLFGSFLVWSVLAFRAARARDRATGATYPALGASRDVIAVIVGAVLWAAFALYLHGPLIGTRPFG